jgi:hypothetical protein
VQDRTSSREWFVLQDLRDEPVPELVALDAALTAAKRWEAYASRPHDRGRAASPDEAYGLARR